MNTKILRWGMLALLSATLLQERPRLTLSGPILPVLAQTNQDQTVTRLYQKASPAVVVINTSKALGSGFLVSADGLIITNAHVVEDGPRVVTVKLSDGRQVSADVIGFAKGGVDLAVLRIYNQKKLPFLTLANPNSIKVGDSVFVIGTPLQEKYQNTLTQGIISRLDPKEGIIQHSANTSPGNSGGPLLNSQGQVIGVHFAGDIENPTYDSSGNETDETTFSGINFAISLDRLQAFLKAVQKGDISSVSTRNEGNQEKSSIFELPLDGQSMEGELNKGCSIASKDWYCNLYGFEGKAGQNITIEMNSQEFDPKFLLFYKVPDEEHKLQRIEISVQHDLGPGDFNAEISVKLPSDGTYLILASSLEHGASGKYILRAVAK